MQSVPAEIKKGLIEKTTTFDWSRYVSNGYCSYLLKSVSLTKSLAKTQFVAKLTVALEWFKINKVKIKYILIFKISCHTKNMFALVSSSIRIDLSYKRLLTQNGLQ